MKIIEIKPLETGCLVTVKDGDEVLDMRCYESFQNMWMWLKKETSESMRIVSKPKNSTQKKKKL